MNANVFKQNINVCKKVLFVVWLATGRNFVFKITAVAAVARRRWFCETFNRFFCNN